MKTITKEMYENDPVILQWVKNYKENKSKGRFDRLSTKPLAYLYRNAYYHKVPVVLLCAGPSLDDNIGQLKEYQNNAIIVCVDMALYAVQQAGITPDFVVSVDSSIHISKMWELCDTRGMKLICPTTTHPDTIDKWEGEIFFFNQIDRADDIKGFILSHLIQPTASYGSIPNRFFVGATALQFLDLFKPSKLIVAGCDFGYIKDRIYCKGVMESRVQDLYGTEQYSIEIEKKTIKVLEEAFTVDGVSTSETMSKLYLDTFYNIVQQLRMDVINSTEGGLLQSNNMKLKQSLYEHCSTPIKKYDTFIIKKKKRKKK